MSRSITIALLDRVGGSNHKEGENEGSENGLELHVDGKRPVAGKRSKGRDENRKRGDEERTRTAPGWKSSEEGEMRRKRGNVRCLCLVFGFVLPS